MGTHIARSKVPFPSILGSQLNDLRKLTDQQWEAWVRWEAEAFSLAGLRRRQDIVASQLRHAWPTASAAGISNLQIHHDIISAAVSLQTFGDDDGWRAFKTEFDRLKMIVVATTGV